MRKTKAKKRPLLPDPKFNDQLVTRFVNNLMLDGKKSIAFKIFYDALDTAGVNGRTQRRSKYGAKRPQPGQAAAPAKGKKK